MRLNKVALSRLSQSTVIRLGILFVSLYTIYYKADQNFLDHVDVLKKQETDELSVN